ncbi:MAG: cytochrome b [Massilia sp.]
MRRRDTPSTYGAMSRLNHWVGALLVLAMLGIGLVFPDLPPGAEKVFLRTLHVALGTILLPLLLWRLVWRMRPSALRPLAQARALGALARLVHGLLLLGLVGMLVTGVLTQWFGGRPIGVFELVRFTSPLAPSELWQERMEQLHGIIAWTMIGLVALHLLGVIKHSLIDGGALWGRMAGRARR